VWRRRMDCWMEGRKEEKNEGAGESLREEEKSGCEASEP